jgi:hypothetical protein
LFKRARERLRSAETNKKGDRKEFAFTRLMQCGICGSSITAQEKFKHLKDGSVNRYVYYGCTRGKDLNCKQGYTREEDLIKELLRIVDQISINELGIRKQLEIELKRFYRFRQSVLHEKGIEKATDEEVDMKNFVRYILKEGSITEKRDLLVNLRSRLVLTNKIITLL